jgi:hypothetical protein
MYKGICIEKRRSICKQYFTTIVIFEDSLKLLVAPQDLIEVSPPFSWITRIHRRQQKLFGDKNNCHTQVFHHKLDWGSTSFIIKN